MSRIAFALFVSAPIPAAADASGWACTNPDIEIACHDGSCEVSEDFTPMQLNLAGGQMRVCAYSGCWKGGALLVESANSLYALGEALSWSHSDSATGVMFQLAFDKRTSVATLNGAGFAHPMICSKWKCGNDCKAE